MTSRIIYQTYQIIQDVCYPLYNNIWNIGAGSRKDNDKYAIF